MNAETQTLVALALVALAAVWLVRRTLAKRQNPGCGGDCGAVSPEVQKLRAKLRR